MPKDLNQQYLIAKSQSESVEDLIGRLLFQLVSLQNGGNAHIAGLSVDEKARHIEKMRYEHSSVLQGKIVEKVLKDIKQAVWDKNIDFSDVVGAIKSIVEATEGGNTTVIEALGQLSDHSTETHSALKNIAQILKENKPKDIVFDELIDGQEAGFTVLGKLITTLTDEIKKKEFSKEIKIDGQVEISKPKWWKEFSLSWEPLENIFEKFSKRTFKIKSDETLQVRIENEIAKEFAKELARILPSLMPRAGQNNPFSFDADGKLLISGGGGGSVDISTLATEATQLAVKNAIQNITIPAPVGGATEAKQDTQITEAQELQIIAESIQELVSRLDFLPSVKGIAADLRVTLLSGVITTVSTVTTVTTVGNQTSIGGFAAAQIVPSQQNLCAIKGNIINIV